jgi:Mg/Co/Ni transporter MgtE
MPKRFTRFSSSIKKRNFVGNCRSRSFVFSKPEQTLDEIADKAAITVGVNTDQEDVAAIFKRYNFDSDSGSLTKTKD